MSEVEDLVLVPVPNEGRVYRCEREVRLGDASPAGRLRLDAVARYLQDIANDDARNAGLIDPQGWVVRRTRIDVLQFPVYQEPLSLATFCGGIGSRWAERRTSIVGAAGGHIECSALWVHIDVKTLRPLVLGPDFHAAYGDAANGRTVSSKLYQGNPEAGLDGGPWPVRFTDFDVAGHLNNASYWSAVEEELSRRRDLRAPIRAEVEHRTSVEPRHAVRLVVVDEPRELRLWMVGEPGVFASAAVTAVSVAAGGATTARAG